MLLCRGCTHSGLTAEIFGGIITKGTADSCLTGANVSVENVNSSHRNGMSSKSVQVWKSGLGRAC